MLFGKRPVSRFNCEGQNEKADQINSGNGRGGHAETSEGRDQRSRHQGADRRHDATGVVAKTRPRRSQTGGKEFREVEGKPPKQALGEETQDGEQHQGDGI